MEKSTFSRSHLFQFLFAAISNLVCLPEGMQFGWASAAVPKLLGNDSYTFVTKEEGKWISNSYIVGDVVGGLFSFVIFNSISRKLSLHVSCLPVLVAQIGTCFSTSASVFYFARFIGGVGRNMVLVAVPMYIGEIANPEVRGTLGTFTNIFMNIGIITVAAVTTYVSITASSIIGIVTATMSCVLVYFLPESPYYLLMKDRKDHAKKSLNILRQSDDVDQELDSLQISVKKQTAEVDSLVQRFLRLFTVKANFKAVCIASFVRSLQMLTGISVVIMHCHTIFERANGSISPEVASLIYYAVLLASCFFSSSTVDKFKRRTLMVISCIFTWLTLTVQGIYFYLSEDGYDLTFLSWLPILNLVLFSLAYRVGLGTVSFVICTEIFSVDVKVAGVVVSNLMFSFSSLLANVIFDYSEEFFGIYTPFWIFGAIAVVGAVFSAFILPDTKGKTLDEIQQAIESENGKKKNQIC